MATFFASLKKKLTPSVVHQMQTQATIVTILWVSGIFFVLGFGLALFCMYNRIFMLEQAIAVLGAR